MGQKLGPCGGYGVYFERPQSRLFNPSSTLGGKYVEKHPRTDYYAGKGKPRSPRVLMQGETRTKIAIGCLSDHLQPRVSSYRSY